MAEIKRLERHEKDWILNDIYHSYRIDESLKKCQSIQFANRLQFDRYLKTDPEFQAELLAAELDSCTYLENDMLNVHKKADDHKMARVLLESYSKVLAYRNPGKYSQKVDLNVTGNLSMKSAIESANSRVEGILREVVEVEAVKAVVAGSVSRAK